MLKIKNDVNLKELKKYGFREYNIAGDIHYEIDYKNANNIKVNGKTRLIHYNILSIYNFIPNVIDDLIKDDLVEKVGE